MRASSAHIDSGGIRSISMALASIASRSSEFCSCGISDHRIAPTIRFSNVRIRSQHAFSEVVQSVEPSPFTERSSRKRVQGAGKLLIDLQRPDDICMSAFAPEPQPQPQELQDEQNDIAARLPELREVLGMLRRQRENDSSRTDVPGNVFLVGTGPGDPELLTVKALRLLQSADLVLYDRLVSTDILDMVHPGANLLYVGKTSGYHSRTQDEIHELLLNFAETGATVVRLKGGDPLVFGRGGEEVEFLQQQGIQVTVVPGITAASGIAAQLGIPLTHRGVANSVRFLTGHARKGGTDPLYVAEQAADPDSTLVIYMGLATLPALAEKLITNGLPPGTPSVAVERGTTLHQRTVFAEFVDLPERVLSAKLVSPTLILIGQVVSLSPLWPERTLATSGTIDETRREPRSRNSRGPDPLLPSQQECLQ